jgi:hypothetical protein
MIPSPLTSSALNANNSFSSHHIFDSMAHHILSTNSFHESLDKVADLADQLTNYNYDEFEPIFSLLVQKFHVDEVVSDYAAETVEVLTMGAHLLEVA